MLVEHPVYHTISFFWTFTAGARPCKELFEKQLKLFRSGCFRSLSKGHCCWQEHRSSHPVSSSAVPISAGVKACPLSHSPPALLFEGFRPLCSHACSFGASGPSLSHAMMVPCSPPCCRCVWTSSDHVEYLFWPFIAPQKFWPPLHTCVMYRVAGKLLPVQQIRIKYWVKCLWTADCERCPGQAGALTPG